MVFGYSIAFTDGNGGWPGKTFAGGSSRIGLRGMTATTVNPIAPNIPETVFMTFQMAFAIIATALTCGGFAERMKFSAMVAFTSLWVLLVRALNPARCMRCDYAPSFVARTSFPRGSSPSALPPDSGAALLTRVICV